MQELFLQAGRESSGTRAEGSSEKTGPLRGVGVDGQVLPHCYQNAPHQDDLRRHPASPDRFGLLGLGRLGYPEYVVRDNS